MRWGLRRDPRGRHALGAAVTALPAAPPRPEVVPVLADQPWSERFPDALSDTQPVAVVADPVRAETTPADPQSVPQVPMPPQVEAVPAPALPEPSVQHLVPVQHLPVQHDVQPVLLGPFVSAAPPVEAPEPFPQVPAARSASEPAAPPAPDLIDGFAALTAFRPPLQAATPLPTPVVAAVPVAPAPAVAAVPAPDPVVVAVPAPPVPSAPAGPRVEIGFTDGTFRMLDPASAAAQALSDLVAELTSRDTGRGATAS